jgi:hypothetical protein
LAYLEGKEIWEAYDEATKEADIWREDYPEYERLMNNGIIEGLDETLPEVNDGSLAAALFKLPKRIISSKLSGRAKALDRDDAWLTELANLQWENNIVPNANSQAPFHRKWKDAVRKSAGYGSQPIINLFVERGNYTGSDFIVPQATDVKLEAGKVSDYDSDIIFWDVYYSETQVKTMLEEAKEEMKEKDHYNTWDIETLQKIVDGDPEVERSGNEEHSERQKKGVKKNGVHFYISFQRGIAAPFAMHHASYKDKDIRAWANPDPTGDIPVHYLYCYQDFINPYGIGIVKLAGGTQNVLDYMRQADVLATQLGLRPPKTISGTTADIDSVDFDSLTYTEDADWEIGTAKIERMEMSTGVYNQLPQRVEMYQSSLNKHIPTGDTSVSAAAGDPTQSKTPAGVKLQAANLSIDDDDFKDNVYSTFNAVAKSMINTHFANMQGSDPMKVTDEERELLSQAGIEFPVDENGEPTNELNIEWDKARAEFDFEVDADVDKAADEAQQLDGLTKITEFLANPTIQPLIQSGQPIILGDKKVNIGELIGTIISLSTDNDKIVTDVSPEDVEQQQLLEQEQLAQQGIDPTTGQPIEQPVEEMPVEGEVMPSPMDVDPTFEGDVQPQQPEITPEQAQANIQAVMEQYGVDQQTAIGMLEAERQGWTDEQIMEAFQVDLSGAQPQEIAA